MSNLGSIIFISVVLFVALLVVGIIFSRLYTRASKERSFVRTGMGGQKVILNGGAMVLPVLHEVIPDFFSLIQTHFQLQRLQVSLHSLFLGF